MYIPQFNGSLHSFLAPLRAGYMSKYLGWFIYSEEKDESSLYIQCVSLDFPGFVMYPEMKATKL